LLNKFREIKEVWGWLWIPVLANLMIVSTVAAIAANVLFEAHQKGVKLPGVVP
jgi:hypothetical protein